MKRLKRVLKWTAIVVAALIAILLIVNAVAIWITGSQLEKRIAALRAAGEPVTLPDLARDPIPPEQNAAVYLRRAQDDLEAVGKELNKLYSNDRHGIVYPDTAELQKIEPTLTAFPDILPLLEQAAACRDYDPQIDYTAGTMGFISDALRSTGPPRRAARFLNARGLLLVSRNRHEDALELGELGFRLARRFQLGPMILGCLATIACRSMAAETVHRALYAGKVPKDAREALDAELARQEHVGAYQWALKSERTFMLDDFHNVHQRSGWTIRALWNSNISCYLDVMDRHIALASLPYREATVEMRRIADGISRIHFMARLLTPAFESLRELMERNRARIRCLRVLNAVQGHVEQTGVAEPELADLGLPKEATIDPFSGKPLQMKKLPDGWLVYSVGRDLTDDGGQLEDMRDVGYGPRPVDDSAEEKSVTTGRAGGMRKAPKQIIPLPGGPALGRKRGQVTISGPQRGRNNTAQGREAHPGSIGVIPPNAESVLLALQRLYNPVGVDVFLLDRYPGCAARPWASMLDRVAVVSKPQTLVDSHRPSRWLCTE